MGRILDDNFDLAKLKALDSSRLPQLCREIRQELIEVVSRNGGHLASNLGSVEICVAADRVFDSPRDTIIFDVGHQSYTHKLLTGRYKDFRTLRKEGGLSGFPKPCESEHDPFVEGHSGPALSEGLGVARARQQTGKPGKTVVVIGDGSFTNGMVYEAINNLSSDLDDLIVILNDNSMSISKSVGAMARYLLMLRSGSGYANFKSGVKNALEKVPVFGKPISKLLVDTKTSIRRTIYDGTLFEELGFRYIGPVDGNDIHEMCYILSNLKETKGPILLHAITSKGKGYRPAEENPGAYHGIDGSVSAVDVTGDAEKETYSTVFGKTLSMLADEDDRICAVTAAMKYGTGLNFFAHAHRNRFYDTGITEEHAAAFCAGLAKEGRKPVFAVYSTFMQRCYDQMFQELVLNDADVLLAVDRAGFVGQDGETHNGLLDPAMLSSLGRIYTVSPASFSELKYWLERLIDMKGPKAIRYPKGTEDPLLYGIEASGQEFDLIKGSNGRKNLFITYGREFSQVLRSRDLMKIEPDILKLNVISPIPEEAVETAAGYDRVIFAEEAVRSGGIAERFLDLASQAGFRGRYVIRAVEDIIQKQASVIRQIERNGLDSASLADLAGEVFS